MREVEEKEKERKKFTTMNIQFIIAVRDQLFLSEIKLLLILNFTM